MLAERRILSSGARWEPMVGYSRAVRVGDWISVAGTTAELVNGQPADGSDLAEQTRSAIRRIAACAPASSSPTSPGGKKRGAFTASSLPASCPPRP
jgi:enamine deaminase RidA (YjgF/YER057c/UK114 family)